MTKGTEIQEKTENCPLQEWRLLQIEKTKVLSSNISAIESRK